MSYINFSLPVSADVAKSNRTACKWLDCKQVIAKGELRFTVAGDYFSYYHAPCFWLSFECKRLASANQPITSTNQIGNYESLQATHKEVIGDLLSGATKPEVPPYVRTNSRPARGSSVQDSPVPDVDSSVPVGLEVDSKAGKRGSTVGDGVAKRARK